MRNTLWWHFIQEIHVLFLLYQQVSTFTKTHCTPKYRLKLNWTRVELNELNLTLLTDWATLTLTLSLFLTLRLSDSAICPTVTRPFDSYVLLYLLFHTAKPDSDWRHWIRRPDYRQRPSVGVSHWYIKTFTLIFRIDLDNRWINWRCYAIDVIRTFF